MTDIKHRLPRATPNTAKTRVETAPKTREEFRADYVQRALQAAVDQGFERVVTDHNLLRRVSDLLVGAPEVTIPRRRAC